MVKVEEETKREREGGGLMVVGKEEEANPDQNRK